MSTSSDHNRFKIPTGYFSQLPDRIMDRIHKDDTGTSVVKKDGYQVPEEYFETFPDRLAERLPKKEVRVRKLWPSRLVWMSAAAAVIVFMLLLIPSREEGGLQFEDLSGESIADYLQVEAFDLSSNDLAESLPLGDIAMEDVMEKMPEDQKIIDYLEIHSDTDDEFYWDRDE